MTKKILSYPILIMFLCFIMLFSIMDIFNGDKGFSQFENRFLFQKPDLTFRSIIDGEYTLLFEKYLNDQFVGRDFWISLKSLSESFFRKIENNEIVYGKDKYMFDKYPIIGDRFDVNARYLREFADMYKHLNITFGIIPNSYEVLKDKVPKGLKNINQADYIKSLYDSITNENISKVDIFQKLLEHKDEYIYYRTDHHWTTLGAYYAYLSYCEKKGLTPVDINKLEKTDIPDFLGTYYSKSKLFNVKPDSLTYYNIPITRVVIGDKELGSMYDYEALLKRDKYSMFLYNNNGYMVIESDNNLSPSEESVSRLLIIKDSYANSMIPFLTYNYDEIHIVDLRHLTMPLKSLMATYEFDDVYVIYNFMNFANDKNLAKLRY